jgi:hypothetical protein
MPSAAVTICALSIVCLCLANCEQGPEKPVRWSTFHSKDAGFAVSIPEGYEVYRDGAEHAFGKQKEFTVQWRKHESSLSHLGLKLLSAGYYDITVLNSRHSAAYILDSFIHEEARIGDILKSGRILDYTSDSFANYPSRQFRSIIDNGKTDSLYLCERFVLAGDRMYHLRMNGYLQHLDTTAMRHFLQSFRLIRPN